MRSPATGLVALAIAVFMWSVGATSAVARVEASFTLAPPGPFAQGARVELRLGLENTTEAPADARVLFSLQAGDSAHTIGEQVVNVPARGKALASMWHQATTKAGPCTYRYVVETSSGTQSGDWPVHVVDGTTRALPYLQGMWVEPLAVLQGAVDSKPETLRAVVRDSVRSMDELGVRVLILAYVEYLGHFFYPSDIAFYDEDIQRESKGSDCVFDMVGAFLAEADARGMHVMLGLGRSGDTQLLWQFERPDWKARNRKAIGTATRIADELWGRYGKHESLYGWYLSHEMNDLEKASAYYDPIARHCHGLAPEKLVLVAPSGTPIITPALLKASEVDIVAYQDAVGSGYIPYVNTFRPEKRIATLETIYKKYTSWHVDIPKHIWSDLEIWEMDGSQGYGGAYPAEFSRVKRQIEIESKHVGLLTGYAYHGYLQSPASAHEQTVKKARTLFKDYSAYLKGVVGPGGE
jgi:hypothetical protein